MPRGSSLFHALRARELSSTGRPSLASLHELPRPVLGRLDGRAWMEQRSERLHEMDMKTRMSARTWYALSSPSATSPTNPVRIGTTIYCFLIFFSKR